MGRDTGSGRADSLCTHYLCRVPDWVPGTDVRVVILVTFINPLNYYEEEGSVERGRWVFRIPSSGVTGRETEARLCCNSYIPRSDDPGTDPNRCLSSWYEHYTDVVESVGGPEVRSVVEEVGPLGFGRESPCLRKQLPTRKTLDRRREGPWGRYQDPTVTYPDGKSINYHEEWDETT